MKYLDLFSGIGGFTLGIQRAYESNIKYAPVSKESEPQERQEGGVRITNLNKTQLHNRDRSAPLCVGYSEIDKYAIQVYKKHFPDHKNFGDITKIRTDELPDFDILVGGFPCQAFSIAGKRRGFDDTRGTLFFEIARILRDKRPRYFVLENVKGLLSHDSGKTFSTILGVLSDIGYDCQWQVLNSKNFGVPQNRERVFIVGHLRGEPRPEVFPISGSSGKAKDLVYAQKADREIARLYDPKGLAPTLHLKTGGWQEPKIAIPVLTPDRIEKRQNGRRFKEDGEPSFTLTGQDKHGIYDGAKIRRLTPLECERLQGFPDGWVDKGIDKEGKEIVVSDTQRYKLLGNAVTTNVIEAIICQFAKSLEMNK